MPDHNTSFETIVRAQCSLFAKHFVAGNFVALTDTYYTEDATFLAPSTPKLTGRAEIAAALSSIKASGVSAITLEPMQLSEDGDLGYEVGRAHLTTPAGVQKARYVVIWRLVGDAWRVHVDMFAMDPL